MEPDAQNVRLETPVSGADPEPGTQRGEVSAALRVQILSTEHWSLLATRSQTWSESFARAQMFLSVLSASVIALALVAQTSRLAPASPPSRLCCFQSCSFSGWRPTSGSCRSTTMSIAGSAA
jgi:hypothetical protein